MPKGGALAPKSVLTNPIQDFYRAKKIKNIFVSKSVPALFQDKVPHCNNNKEKYHTNSDNRNTADIF
jgi:hypothetical protein